MEQWIASDLKSFQKIYEQYNQTEPELASCAMMMVRILNGLSEMTFTQFHRYEKKMFGKAIALFSRQCIGQIEKAIVCNKDIKKKEYIEDLEMSISEIVAVYENTVGGVSNVERQIFQSLAVDARVYDLSPKLCAFYSSILDKVVEIFREEEMEYAFVLHPMLRSTIEAKVLLEKREESGKVVIIYIPEGIIEKFDLVCICLIHEAFHILTKKERDRQGRMRYFTGQMIAQIQEEIFKGVSFGERDKSIKEKLSDRWFVEMRRQLGVYDKTSADDRIFYSECAKKEVGKKLKECLVGIAENLEEVIRETDFQICNYRDYSDFWNRTDMVLTNIEVIKRNILQISTENVIAELCDDVMFLYRETYADIACVLFLKIGYNLYNKAFEDSIRFKRSTAYRDDVRDLRERLVGEVIAHSKIGSQQESWKQYADQMSEKDVNDSGNEANIEQNDGQNGEACVNICIDRYTKDLFMEYLKGCAVTLQKRMESIAGLDVFQGEIEKVITGNPQELLEKVLGGYVIQ